MDGDELYTVMLLGFMLGTIGLVYYPGLVAAVLPYIALLGAFYLVFGILTRMTGFAFGIGWSRKEDWLNGIILLVLVVILLGSADLAVNSVQYMVKLFSTLFRLALTIV